MRLISLIFFFLRLLPNCWDTATSHFSFSRFLTSQFLMLVPRPVERGHVRAEGPHVRVDVAREGVAEGRRGGEGGDERPPAVRPGGLQTKSRHGRGDARQNVAEPVRLRGR